MSISNHISIISTQRTNTIKILIIYYVYIFFKEKRKLVGIYYSIKSLKINEYKMSWFTHIYIIHFLSFQI